MQPLATATLVTLGLGAYSLYEPFRFRLTHQRVPLDGPTPALCVLHISDMHMRRRQHKLASWLKGLPGALGAVPDLVLATGDMIEGNDGIDPLLEALSALRARLGCFYVLGSHDYYAPVFRAVTKYFGTSHGPVGAPPANTERLEAGLSALGWNSLVNTSRIVESDQGRVRLTGVDDPYLNRHRTQHIHRDADDVLAIGLMHSPDVIDEWFAAGYDLVLAGHTHGGQVRVPGIGALVTNCSLPNALASGLHRVKGGWLHVSPGLGTGKYSPIRFACRPEATLLHLVPERQPTSVAPPDGRRR